jgi:hypothetical protein
MARLDCRSLQQVVVEQAVVDSMHYTTVARLLAAASLQPHRSRDWKTATIDERFITKAARILWRYERVARLYARGEVVLCLEAKPPLQPLAIRVPAQPTRAPARAGCMGSATQALRKPIAKQLKKAGNSMAIVRSGCSPNSVINTSITPKATPNSIPSTRRFMSVAVYPCCFAWQPCFARRLGHDHCGPLRSTSPVKPASFDLIHSRNERVIESYNDCNPQRPMASPGSTVWAQLQSTWASGVHYCQPGAHPLQDATFRGPPRHRGRLCQWRLLPPPGAPASPTRGGNGDLRDGGASPLPGVG